MERNNEIQRAALMLQRVQVGLAADSRTDADVRDAEKRKRALEDEQRQVASQLSLFDEQLRSATKQEQIADLQIAKRRLEVHRETLQKDLEEATQRLTAAVAVAQSSRKTFEEWLHHVDKLLAKQ